MASTKNSVPKPTKFVYIADPAKKPNGGFKPPPSPPPKDVKPRGK